MPESYTTMAPSAPSNHVKYEALGKISLSTNKRKIGRKEVSKREVERCVEEHTICGALHLSSRSPPLVLYEHLSSPECIKSISY